MIVIDLTISVRWFRWETSDLFFFFFSMKTYIYVLDTEWLLFNPAVRHFLEAERVLRRQL